MILGLLVSMLKVSQNPDVGEKENTSHQSKRMGEWGNIWDRGHPLTGNIWDRGHPLLCFTGKATWVLSAGLF